MTTRNGAPPAQGLITRDTPVGYELVGVKKKAAIQLMGSRLWGRFNPNHWDPGLRRADRAARRPIQTGEMSSAYLAEMCVNHFGRSFFRGARMQCKYVSSILANEVITTHGVVREKTPKGDGFRFTVEIWAAERSRREEDRRRGRGRCRRLTPAQRSPGLVSGRRKVPPMTSTPPATDSLRPMTDDPGRADRERSSRAWTRSRRPTGTWSTVGDELTRDLHLTPELVILYADGVEDYNPWYEAWLMNTWQVEGESPFGGGHRPADAGVALRAVGAVRPHQAVRDRHDPHLPRLARSSSRSRSGRPCASHQGDRQVRQARAALRPARGDGHRRETGTLYFTETRDNLSREASDDASIERCRWPRTCSARTRTAPRCSGRAAAGCGTHYFPKSLSCRNPQCDVKTVEEALLGRTGQLYSYTVQAYRPPALFRMEPVGSPMRSAWSSCRRGCG